MSVRPCRFQSSERCGTLDPQDRSIKVTQAFSFLSTNGSPDPCSDVTSLVLSSLWGTVVP